ncbi:Cof-type HAD-IIB family hydrolase [[Mycoplasma] collis]|uniref:Cof-type HAD-IIB family hydrolase n=1 Tax=[Mycoplasma] collis TaxID=2127 RepID=UPI00051AADA0|nr:Cof-type HAD-IIB family hydrolase [[Mycoplasma] collis]
MENVKALFLDLDGTLLDVGIGKWAKISDNNKNAVLEFSQKGKVIISTGRSFNLEVKKIAQTVNASFTVCQNGSQIYDQNFNLIKDLKISYPLVNQVFEIVKEWKASFVANSSIFIYGPFFWNKLFSLFSNFKAKKYKFFNAHDSNKILIIHRNKTQVRKIHQKINEKFFNDLKAEIVGKNWAIEITEKNCTKGKAAEYILDLLNINANNSIHIGDSMNDSSTSGIVGKLIAMKSGSNKLKKIADEIGEKRKKAGVAKILKNLS